MTLVLKVIYETDSEPRDTPWRHYENLDEKIIDFFEGLGMSLYGSDFSFDNLTRMHEFEFDKGLDDEIPTFTLVEEDVSIDETDVFVAPGISASGVFVPPATNEDILGTVMPIGASISTYHEIGGYPS